MEYFRKFLIEIRKRENKDTSKFSFKKQLIAVFFVGTIIGVFFDSLLPFNFFLNMIRGLLATVMGFSAFSYLYLMSVKKRESMLAKDRYYSSFRKKFSFNQRVNISLTLGAILFVLVLTIGGIENALYTLQSSMFILAILGITSFVRRDRKEFLSSVYEIPDTRDFKKKV